MNHSQLVEIGNAKGQIDAVKAANASFLAHANAHAVPDDIPTKLEFSNGRIKVESFGHVAEAAPRVVRSESGSYAVEYVFYVPWEEAQLEVSRFYLISNGRLLESPDGDVASTAICDFNNGYVAKHLCGRVMLGVLHSRLFKPSESPSR